VKVRNPSTWCDVLGVICPFILTIMSTTQKIILTMNRRQYRGIEKFIMYLLSCYLSDELFPLFAKREHSDISDMFSLFVDLGHFLDEASDRVITVDIELFNRFLAGMDSIIQKTFANPDFSPEKLKTVITPTDELGESFGNVLKTFYNPGMIRMIDHAMELSN